MGSHSLRFKVLVTSFLISLMLWGCADNYQTRSIAIKVATSYCEANGGIEWIRGDQYRNSYKAKFMCKNGLQSDWQEMTEEKK